MVKGRRLITSRSERFLGSLGYSHGHEAASGAPELREDEVWSMIDEKINGDSHSSFVEVSARTSSESMGSFGSKSRAMTARAVCRKVGGLSLAFDDSIDDSSSMRSIVHQFRAPDNSMVASPHGRHMATSAPVNVPDWSKIYRVNSVESLPDSDDGLNGDSEIVPPHEYLGHIRKLAANSVFEGVGRTLKGRDLSRVRDAVWSQTGFYG